MPRLIADDFLSEINFTKKLVEKMLHAHCSLVDM